MKVLLTLIICIVSVLAHGQLTEVKYQNSSNEVLSMAEYEGESVSWTVSDNEILWQYYDKDSNLLLNENYTIISKHSVENVRSVYYIARSVDNTLIKFQFWILDDGSKSVTVGYSETYVNYFGNVSFNINL